MIMINALIATFNDDKTPKSSQITDDFVSSAANCGAKYTFKFISNWGADLLAARGHFQIAHGCEPFDVGDNGCEKINMTLSLKINTNERLDEIN